MDLINEILSWICLISLLCYGHVLLVNKGNPNIPTGAPFRRKIAEIVKAETENRGKKDGAQTFTVVDMGAGNGKLTRAIARAVPDARVIGLEFSPVAVLTARVMAFLTGFKNLTYVRGDFYAFDTGGVDAVVMYLAHHEMERMGQKLKKELPAGALIVLNTFPLKAGWGPYKEIEDDGERALGPRQPKLYLYRKETP